MRGKWGNGERSFSKYKYLLTDNRCSFTFDDIKYALIVQRNNDKFIKNFIVKYIKIFKNYIFLII